jgi:hypothetical protein
MRVAHAMMVDMMEKKNEESHADQKSKMNELIL